MRRTRASSTVLETPAQVSRIESASRMAPSARRPISSAAAGSRSIFSSPATYSSRPAISLAVIREKSYRWQRDRMVAGTFCTSVVARMKMTCSGGSSIVLSRALKAEVESMWTSSMMYTLYLHIAGR